MQSGSPDADPERSPRRCDPVGLLRRVMLAAAYCSLGLWILLFAGMSFTVAFLTTFVVENRLDERVWVTPVGRWRSGDDLRSPLPVSHFVGIAAVRSFVRGGYELPPGESVSITYDFDDIAPTEIVVEDATGGVHQMVAEAGGRHFVVQATTLAPATTPVLNAARDARRWSRAGVMELLVIILPWPTIVLLSWLVRRRRPHPQ